MTILSIQQVIASFPVKTADIASKLCSLIDKKLSGVALGALEEKKHLQAMKKDLAYKALYEEKSARISTLSDETVKVYDATADKIVGFCLLSGQKRNHLTLKEKGKAVVVQGYTFAREYAFTDYIVVQNKGPRVIEIIEQETLRPGKETPLRNTFIVNLDNVKKLSKEDPYPCGCKRIIDEEQEEMYVPEVSDELRELVNSMRN